MFDTRMHEDTDGNAVPHYALRLYTVILCSKAYEITSCVIAVPCRCKRAAMSREDRHKPHDLNAEKKVLV